MATRHVRWWVSILLAAGMAGITANGERLTAQVQVIVPGQAVPPAQQPPPDAKDAPNEPPDDDDRIPFTFPYDRNVRNYLTGVREYLAGSKQPPWATVTDLLQKILEAKSDSFYKNYYTVGGQKKLHRVSVKVEANRLLGSFPPEGLDFYQQAYGQIASAQLDEAIRQNYDMGKLAEVAQKYFHTRAGGEAAVLLATLYLERGNYLEAAYIFERLWQRPRSEEFKTPLTVFKAALAWKRSGDPRHGELYKTAVMELQKLVGRDGLLLGAKRYRFEQLRAELERPVEWLRVTATPAEWAMRGGHPTRNAVATGGPPFLNPVFQYRLLPYSNQPAVQEANDWIKTELERVFTHDARTVVRQGIPLPGLFPITTADSVIFRTYDGVYCVASRDQVAYGRPVRSGELLWAFKTEAGLHQLLTAVPGINSQSDIKTTVDNWWKSFYFPNGSGNVLCENYLVGSLAHDGQLVYLVDDIWLPPPPVYNNPEMGIVTTPQYRRASVLGRWIHAGSLCAVNVKNGSLVWQLGRVSEYGYDFGEFNLPPLPPPPNEDEADQITSAFHLCLDAIFVSTPLPLHGKLYVLIEQAGVLRLLCLDPYDLEPVPQRPYMRVPRLVWSQKLGQPGEGLPQNSFRRIQNCQLAAADGIIVCPTNSGAVIAVDLMSHSLLWAHGYATAESPQDPRRPPGLRPPVPRPYNVINPLRPHRWRAAGPIIASGRVILTAYDSDRLECLDLRTGQLLWWVPRDVNDLYVAGVFNDKVLVVGRNQLRAYHLFGEDPATQRPRVAYEGIVISTPTGHGAAANGVYYLPVRPDNAGRDGTPPAEIWGIDIDTGAIRSKTAARTQLDMNELARYGLGNLIFHNGYLLAQSAWEIAGFPLLEQKRAEMDRLLAANPDDPVGLLTRGELLLDEGRLAEAIRDLKKAQQQQLPPEKQPTLREKLYVAYTELIRKDFPQAEPYLEEYRRLCEVPERPGETAEEKIRRLDETERRIRLYEYLMARGREQQRRLGDAFEHYIRLAQMGDARRLLEMPDEPNVRIRPDVWARGRIELMMQRATDPAIRRPLEERVRQQWEQVRTANDLARLREFVNIFGLHFASGADAQLLLAEKLLETRNDNDLREAQMLLLQLRAAASDRAVRAQATEALARLMIAQRMMEDAVALYVQLDREFADVPIRDGKTGADFAVRLLTDRRLLPYLEPQRYPLPRRYRPAEVRTEPMPIQPQIELEVSGELLPVYRRYRFVIDQAIAGNNTWTLRVFDKQTGKEEMRFSNITPTHNIYIPTGGIPYALHGHGHLLLLHLGVMVYCFDLSRGSELKQPAWQINLLGEGTAINPNRQIMAEVSSEGRIYLRLDDTFAITVGRSAVLRSHYAAVLTRDGLEVVDPRNRRQLWIRQDIRERTHLYGDDRYILLVETNAQHRPVAVRILRAIDGTLVEGVPDAGRLLAAAAAYEISGQYALVFEKGDDHQAVTLRWIDLVAGKDVWSRNYPMGTLPVRSGVAGLAAVAMPDGVVDVCEVTTGRTVATLRIDPENVDKHVKPCVRAQLLADAERFYLLLYQPEQAGGRRRQNFAGPAVRFIPFHGTIYAFDRSSGQRLWYIGDGLLDQQMLMVERFEELPMLMFASPVIVNNTTMYALVAVEKDRGKLLLDRNVPFQGIFQKLDVNMSSGEVQLGTYNLRIRFVPEQR